MTAPTQTLNIDEMFRPPINRAMRSLDRSFFRKKCMLPAACILDNKQIQRTQKDLSHEILKLERLQPIRPAPAAISKDGKLRCLLLRSDIKIDGLGSLIPLNCK